MPIFEFDLFGVRVAPTYYGAAYALAFALGYWILGRRKAVPESRLDDLVFWTFLGVFLGGRLGYVLFYDFRHYLAHPAEIVQTWKGGMSFHGGVVGVILAMWGYSRGFREPFLRTADEVTYVLPIGLFLGRLANYVNGELYGYAPYSGPFAMLVDGKAHFPSPLLEAALEGPALFLLLHAVSRSDKRPGTVAATFLAGYAAARIFAEFFRLPDAQVGYLVGRLTMGQLLSLAMLVGAGVAYASICRKPRG